MKPTLRSIFYGIPLVAFLGLGYFLWKGLDTNPRLLPSTLIGKPIPAFQLSTLENPARIFSNKDLLGQVSLLNIWATWCVSCHSEHAVLTAIAKQDNIKVYGLNYKDDRYKAQQWLADYGNPYVMSGFDEQGHVAINLGVYGTPETFIIDKQGIVRYRYVGAITLRDWQFKLKPLVQQLERGL